MMEDGMGPEPLKARCNRCSVGDAEIIMTVEGTDRLLCVRCAYKLKRDRYKERKEG